MNIDLLYQGISDKLGQLKKIAEGKHIPKEKFAYIGDDLNDLDCIRYYGVTSCPAGAVPEVQKVVDYICKHNGGSGAVREFIDFLKRRE